LNKEELPEEWKESIVVPICKKGDKTDCSNYRRISLVLTTYKIVSNILLSRLTTGKDMVMTRDQNVGQSHKINNDNSSFERVEEFKYFGTTLTDQNSVQEEIKSRLKSQNACYYSMQNILSSSFLSKNINFNITIVLPVVLYGCETWSLTFREERRLRVFENRVLRRILGLRWTR
jgi:hypothetical protein